jgi:predicted ATP-dependent endonuclease of OLD family
MVGKNESGKTAFLEALSLRNPVVETLRQLAVPLDQT